MSDHGITDKYGAIVLIKMMIATLKEDTEKKNNQTMMVANEIVIEYLEKDLADIQGEIFKEFTGMINGLSEKVKEINDD